MLFVLGDLLTGNSVFLTGPDTEVGEINGTKISYAEYEQRLQQALAMQFPTTAPTEQQREQVREQVWADFVRDFRDFISKVGDSSIRCVMKENPPVIHYVRDSHCLRSIRLWVISDFLCIPCSVGCSITNDEVMMIPTISSQKKNNC